MESKKKNLIVGIVVILCILVVIGGGFFIYNNFFVNTPKAEAEEEFVNEVQDEQIESYQIDGYEDYDQWFADLTIKRESYQGFAENKISELEGYLNDEQKGLLREYENSILTASTITEITEYENKINDIVNPAQEQKTADEEAAKNQEVVYTDNSYGYYDTGYTNYNYSNYGSYPSGVLSAYSGVNSYNGYTEKYYNLNMSGVVNNAQAAGIQGNYWVRDDGVKMYGDYVIVASQHHNKGEVIDTSLGTGIVLDYCETPGVVDIATTW